MNLPIDSVKYKDAIRQIVDFQNIEEIEAYFDNIDNLLNQKLFEILTLCISESSDSNELPRLRELEKSLKIIYGKKCLFQFFNKDTNEAHNYVVSHFDAIFTQHNFNLINTMIAECSENSRLTTLVEKYDYLVYVAIYAYLFIQDWPTKRIFLIENLKWLNNDKSESIFNFFKTHKSLQKNHIELSEELVKDCSNIGTEITILNVDIHLLIKQIEDSQSENKIYYIEKAISLTFNVNPELWASLQVDLAEALFKVYPKTSSDRYGEIIKAYNEALKVYNKKQYSQEWANVQFELGCTYLESTIGNLSENVKEAITALEHSLEIFIPSESPEKWASINNLLGNAYTKDILQDKALDIRKGIKYYIKALSIRTYHKYPNEWAVTQNNLGVALSNYTSGDYANNMEKAIRALKMALKVRTYKDFPRQWAMTKKNLANVYLRRIYGNPESNLETAIRLLKQTLKVYTYERFPQQWAVTLNKLGMAFSKRIRGKHVKNIENAIKVFEQVINVFTFDLFPGEWAKNLNDLSNAYLELKGPKHSENIEKAIKGLTQILDKLSLTDSNSIEFGTTLNNLALAYFERIEGYRNENIELAIEYIDKALTIRTEQNYPLEWAESQNNLGTIYTERIKGEKSENIEKAIKTLEKTLKIFTPGSHFEQWVKLQNNLGRVYLDRIRGDRRVNLELAIEYLENASKNEIKKLLPAHFVLAKCNLGAAYSIRLEGDRSCNLEYAIEIFNEVLDICKSKLYRQQWGDAQLNLGNVYLDRIKGERSTNLNQSIDFSKKALTVKTRQEVPLEWAAVQNNLGIAYSLQVNEKNTESAKKAIECFSLSLEVRTYNLFPKECRATSINLGNLYYKLGFWSEARNAYEQVHRSLDVMRIETMNIESRSKIAKENAEIYANLIHCCLKLEDIRMAIEYTLVTKSRSLAEQINTTQSSFDEMLSQNPNLAEQWEPIKNLQAELDELQALLRLRLKNKERVYTRIRELRREINLLTETLIFSFPTLLTFQPLPALSLTQIQNLAVELGNKTLIEYVLHGGGWGAFIITSHSVNYVALDMYTLPYTKDTLKLLHQKEDNFWDGNWKSYLSKLFDYIFAPLSTYLPKTGSIVLAPSGLLHLVPFQALINPEGRYLSEFYAFSFVPSVATLHILYEQHKNKTKKTRSLMSVAYSGIGEEYLPNVLAEVASIKKCFKKTVELLEENAHRDKVIFSANSHSFEVIHFSCHGSFSFQNPENSGLFLAEESILTLNDIRLRLRLKDFPLVTLSACETGRIKPERGDESMNLSWAFMIAGASGVVSSLWSVDDESTMRLFEHFYKLRRVTDRSDAEALQMAMAQVRQNVDYSDSPYYWAAFQVMGLPISN